MKRKAEEAPASARLVKLAKQLAAARAKKQQLQQQQGEQQGGAAGAAGGASAQAPPTLPEGSWRFANASSISAGVIARRNRRPRMEDGWAMSEDLLAGGPLKLRAFSVFDGHGGSFASAFCAKMLHRRLAQQLARHGGAGNDQGGVATCMPACLNAAYLAVDSDMACTPAAILSGCAAVTCVLSQAHLFAAWSGDSRAVLCRGGAALPLTQDHKPARADEHARVRKAGGLLLPNHGLRVMGMLAMTRALGDHALQQFGVTPVPEVACIERDAAADDFLLLATDGLWDALSSDAAVALATQVLRAAERRGMPRTAAGAQLVPRVLAVAAAARGSNDNCTIIWVDMRQQGEPHNSSTCAAATSGKQCSDVLKGGGTLAGVLMGGLAAAAPQLGRPVITTGMLVASGAAAGDSGAGCTAAAPAKAVAGVERQQQQQAPQCSGCGDSDSSAATHSCGKASPAECLPLPKQQPLPLQGMLVVEGSGDSSEELASLKHTQQRRRQLEAAAAATLCRGTSGRLVSSGASIMVSPFAVAVRTTVLAVASMPAV